MSFCTFCFYNQMYIKVIIYFHKKLTLMLKELHFSPQVLDTNADEQFLQSLETHLRIGKWFEISNNLILEFFSIKFWFCLHFVCFPYIAWNVTDTTSSQQSADDEDKENKFTGPITRAHKQKKGRN